MRDGVEVLCTRFFDNEVPGHIRIRVYIVHTDANTCRNTPYQPLAQDPFRYPPHPLPPEIWARSRDGSRREVILANRIETHFLCTPMLVTLLIGDEMESG